MPWYVEYGWLIAWVFVAALALVPITIIRTLRRLADKKRAVDERFRFDVGVSALSDGPVTLHGTYRRDGDKQWIDHQGDRVDIVGPMTIIRGTRVRDVKGKRHHELHDGDLVIVKGTAARSGGTSSYRELANRWTIEADGALKPLEACASKPSARGRPLPPTGLAAILVVSTVMSWAGLRWYGKKQLAKYPLPVADVHELKPLRFREPAVIASMMPGSHERALAHLFAVYKSRVERSQANLDARVAILSKIGGRLDELLNGDTRDSGREGDGPTSCHVAAAELNDQSRFEEALARKCGGYTDAFANLALGHYNRLVDDVSYGMLGQAAAKNWLEVSRVTRPPLSEVAGWLTAGVTDVTPLLDLQRGTLEYDSRDKFEAMASDLRWALDPSYVETSDFVPVLAELARGKQVESSGSGYSYSARYDNARAVTLRRTWLSALAPDSARDVHAFRMYAAILRGDFATARTERDAARADKLAASIELREGTYKDPKQPAIDGRKVAHLLRTFDSSWPQQRVDYFETVHATSHRDEVRRAMKLAAAERAFTDPANQLVFVHELAVERDLARAWGDAAGAARWQAIIDRHLAALRDPTQVVFAVFRTL